MEWLMPVRTRFVTTPDGVRLAWTEHGSGQPLVLSRGWITHVELSWADPAFRRFIEALAQSTRVVRFDHRGMGLSDRKVGVPDLEALVTDLATVIDVVASGEPVVLWGSLFGGPAAVRYTARSADRVSRLILDTTWARPSDVVNEGATPVASGVVDGIRASPDPEPLLAYASYLSDPNPEARHEERIERVRKSIAPDLLADLYSSIGSMDVEQDATRLTVPTLVLQRTECFIPLAAGQRLACTAPDAQLVALPGRSGNLWEGDTAGSLEAITEFLGLPPTAAQASPARGRGAVAVLLMTDLVESTSVTARLGDEAAQSLQAFHDEVVRQAVAGHGGVECDHTGDGILARLDSAAEAVRCAEQIQVQFADRNRNEEVPLFVRVGLNAGEPLPRAGEGDKVFGTAVQKTARVCAAAGPAEVLVAPVIRALVEGKGFTFEDRGEHDLKGFAEPIRLYALQHAATQDGVS
jgi:class 3 adenylate cyclase/alpha-beta hydrolase superfamily lysophospholipase